MNPELRDLYQQVIIDHGKRPRNFRRLEGASHHAEGFNPLCGDKLDLYLTVSDDGRIEDVAFEGSGCAISTASASMMTQSIKGKTLEEADKLFHCFHCLVTGQPCDEALKTRLDKLEVFAGVKEYPTRVKCAILAWHTLNAALENKDRVTTE